MIIFTFRWRGSIKVAAKVQFLPLKPYLQRIQKDKLSQFVVKVLFLKHTSKSHVDWTYSVEMNENESPFCTARFSI